MKIRRFAFFAIASLILLSTSVLAQDLYWVGDSGSWDDPNNWSITPGGSGGDGPPTAGTAYLTSNDAISRNILCPSGTNCVGSFIIDALGTGSLTYTIDGSHDIGLVIVGNYGTGNLIISGGNIGHGNIILGNQVGGTGNLNFSSGSVSATMYYIGAEGTGNVIQTGGHLHASESLLIGTSATGNGTYNLIDGTIFTESTDVGNHGNGTFNQSGGSHTAAQGSVIGGNGGTGIYNLFSGEAQWGALTIGSSGTGYFNQYGGINSVLASDYIHIGSNGVYTIAGGIYNGFMIKNGGVINYSGGNLNLGGPLTNDVVFSLSGNGSRNVNFDVINNGIIKTNNTTAYYKGTFTNNGAYISDPATQYFTDLIIGQNGYLVGQLADAFKISGDLISSSIMNIDWNTRQSYLQFITGTDSIHDFYLTAADYGANMPGYANNFAWGTLDVTGNIVHFYDGNSETGAALYLREILGLDITDLLIANLFGFDGLNIYYMANLPGNEFLHGLTYDLAGGGHLAPIPTPEPSTMLLLGSGLVGLVGYGRRRLKK